MTVTTWDGPGWPLLSQALPLLIVGYSVFEGVGSALMIPPIYILVTVAFPDVKARARYFGVIGGAAGLGAAAGPLIGGVVTSAFSWRASFGLQVLVVASIIWLGRKIADPGPAEPRPRFDLTGAPWVSCMRRRPQAGGAFASPRSRTPRNPRKRRRH